ncbi:hypothetical protein LZ31DRAFT_323260 [Colletotrichum somersetense]|nr:hypothetical protein LZ31DRAFT_323260 [Colletotrichum somersetense]
MQRGASRSVRSWETGAASPAERTCTRKYEGRGVFHVVMSSTFVIAGNILRPLPFFPSSEGWETVIEKKGVRGHEKMKQYPRETRDRERGTTGEGGRGKGGERWGPGGQEGTLPNHQRPGTTRMIVFYLFVLYLDRGAGGLVSE